jgi:hypothetical protein
VSSSYKDSKGAVMKVIYSGNGWTTQKGAVVMTKQKTEKIHEKKLLKIDP